MESRVKFAGHPVHPMLIVFPLGLLGAAVVFDIVYLISDNSQWAVAAHYMIGAGLIGGLAAALFGWLDWLGIPAGTRAKRLGLWHGLGNMAVVVLFILSWLLRRENPAMPPTGAIVAGLSGVMLSLITAWLGGELVYRLAVGVDGGAHLDSPSSLSELPAGAGLSAARKGDGPSSFSG
ncbi:MAG: DUF2231 domain-containing protein [Gemmatimonadales bacterium]|nr:DUF2231 domain-containing protein [Gemmatimonadales bacterium]